MIRAMATAATLPTNLEPYFTKGVQAYTQGSYDYAVDLLTFVVHHAPDATEAPLPETDTTEAAAG